MHPAPRSVDRSPRRPERIEVPPRGRGTGASPSACVRGTVWPELRKKLLRRIALDAYKRVIDEMLRTDLDAPRKQRQTITRIFHQLVEEPSKAG